MGGSAPKYFGIPWSGNILFPRKKAAPYRRRFNYGNMGQESLKSHHCSLITALCSQGIFVSQNEGESYCPIALAS